MPSSIFAKTHAEFASSFDRGKLLAGTIYRQWFKKGQLFLDEPALKQAPSLVQTICQETDWSLPPLVTSRSEGDTNKFLLQTHDGYEMESVCIPMKTLKTLCISSQIGCRMGCTFCETGRMGLLRHLSAQEIVSQVYFARFSLNLAVRNVVFMGMGEPFDNFDEVKQAIRVLSDQNGLAFGMHNITVSTSGKIEGIRRLAEDPEISPNLAISLNAANDGLRSKLMPHNRKENISQIRQAIQAYCSVTSKQVLVAYVLMKNVNDSLSHADELIDFVKDLDVKVNLIPYNAQAVDRFQTSDPEVVEGFMTHLRTSGVRVLLRRTKGNSIMAACGQLGNAKSRRLLSIVN